MGDPVVHFEIIGRDAERLQTYYAQLFGWEFDTGFVDADSAGINGNVEDGEEHERRVMFYVAVPDVEAALQQAEDLGGTRRMGPEGTPGTLVVGRFTDPDGNLIGVAGER